MIIRDKLRNMRAHWFLRQKVEREASNSGLRLVEIDES